MVSEKQSYQITNTNTSTTHHTSIALRIKNKNKIRKRDEKKNKCEPQTLCICTNQNWFLHRIRVSFASKTATALDVFIRHFHYFDQKYFLFKTHNILKSSFWRRKKRHLFAELIVNIYKLLLLLLLLISVLWIEISSTHTCDLNSRIFYFSFCFSHTTSFWCLNV